MTAHRFSTPEGIEIAVKAQREGPIDGCWCLDFTVHVEVPGYITTVQNLPFWKQALDIRAHRVHTHDKGGETE